QIGNRLAALVEGDRSVGAAFALSYRHLPTDQQRAFATLGVHPGVEFEPYATAALLDTSAADAARLLRGLEQVNLLDQPTPPRHPSHAPTPASPPPRAAPRPGGAGGPPRPRLHPPSPPPPARAPPPAPPSPPDPLPRPPQPPPPAPPLPDPAAAAAWLVA